MPQAIGAAVASFFGTGFTATLISSAVSLGVSTLLSKALGGSGSAGEGAERKSSILSADQPDRISIGRNRTSGPVHIYSNDVENIADSEYVYGGVILCEGPIEEVDRIWIGDKRIDHPDFSNAELAERELIFTGDYVQCTGGAGVPFGCTLEPEGSYALTFDGTIYTYTPVGNHTAENVRDDLLGQLSTANTQISFEAFEDFGGVDTGYGIRFTRNTANTVNDWDIDLSVVNTNTVITHVNNLVKGAAETVRYVDAWHTLGNPDELSHPELVANLDWWTADHRARGRAMVFIKIQRKFLRENLGGMPNIDAEYRGRNDIVDFRTGLAGYTENPIVAWHWYTKTKWFKDANNRNILDAEWNSDLISAMNYCDEQVVKNSLGDTQARYAFNGSFQVSNQLGDIKTLFEEAIGGKIITVGGKWRAVPAAFRLPTKTLVVNDLASDWQITNGVPEKERYTAAGGNFTHAAQQYETDGYPVVALDPSDISPRYAPIDFDAEIDPIRAQRLAMLKLKRGDAPKSIQFQLKRLTFDPSPTETYYLDLPDLDVMAWEIQTATKDHTSGTWSIVMADRVESDYDVDDYTLYTQMDAVDTNAVLVVRDDILE